MGLVDKLRFSFKFMGHLTHRFFEALANGELITEKQCVKFLKIIGWSILGLFSIGFFFLFLIIAAVAKAVNREGM